MHRLDMDTSGCLLFARSPKARASFQKAFEQRMVEKHYLAVIGREVNEEQGTVDAPLAKVSSAEAGWRMVCDPKGQGAVTNWRRVAARDGQTLVEFRPVTALLQRAGRALSFSPRVAAAARPRIAALFALPPEQRVPPLLELLHLLAGDDAAVPLATAPALPAAGADRGRIDRVLEHIHRHYGEGLQLGALADVAALSESGLHRLFRRHMQQTITSYVAALRIGSRMTRAKYNAKNRPIRKMPVSKRVCTVQRSGPAVVASPGPPVPSSGRIASILERSAIPP